MAGKNFPFLLSCLRYDIVNLTKGGKKPYEMESSSPLLVVEESPSEMFPWEIMLEEVMTH